MQGVMNVNTLRWYRLILTMTAISCVADLTQTQVQADRFVRIMGWYDNEWGLQTACWTPPPIWPQLQS